MNYRYLAEKYGLIFSLYEDLKEKVKVKEATLKDSRHIWILCSRIKPERLSLCVPAFKIVLRELSRVSSISFCCQTLQQPCLNCFALICQVSFFVLLFLHLSLKFFFQGRQAAFLMSKGASQTPGPFSATLDNNFMTSKFIPISGKHADQG